MLTIKTVQVVVGKLIRMYDVCLDGKAIQGARYYSKGEAEACLDSMRKVNLKSLGYTL